MSLKTYLEAAPKVELHVHLEGSIRPDMLLTLARRNAVSLPADSVEGLRDWFHFRDFRHFLDVYMAITRCLRRQEDYAFITYEFGAEMARQHVRYAEVTFSPSTHHALGIPDHVFLDGLAQGRAQALAAFGVRIAWVFDIVRSVSDFAECHRLADYTTAIAIDYRDQGVVALGLGGMEAGYPAALFAPYFERARAAGLHSTPHSGETGGPDSMWESLRLLGAERIGHGVRAIESPELVAHLAQGRIPLEVNPTSNIRLGIYPDYAAHPLRRLHNAGVTVTVNSDDPPLFNTTLNDELALLAGPFGFDATQVDAVDTILLNAVRYSFLPLAEKAALEQDCLMALAALKREHL
jgi:adenosine deaminase